MKSFAFAAAVCLAAALGAVRAEENTVVIRAGADWIPVGPFADVEAGSALDFSARAARDAPAGRHGFLRAAGPHFEFEGRPGVPVRLYGANLCSEACYPRTDEEADRLVARLVRAGYNSIRLHHHDGFLYRRAQGGRLELVPDRVEKLDRFLARAFAAGLYATTDLYVSRKTPWEDYKTLLFVDEDAIRDWEEAARLLLTHRNPFTGRTYADEPALATICLVNENSIQQTIQSNASPLLLAAWGRWLEAERRERPGRWPTLSPDRLPADGGGWSAAPLLKGEAWCVVSLFCAELETRMFTRMRDFLRGELGVRALLADQNWGTQSAAMQKVRAELYDYTDSHMYVDHPAFPEKDWRLPSVLENKNILARPDWGPEISWRRVADRPFTVSEWNFCGPNRFRSQGGLVMGALAAAQDWDALWRFSFSHWFQAYETAGDHPGYFDAVNDPVNLLSERIVAALFLRGDLPPFPHGVALELTPEAVSPASDDHACNVLPAWFGRQWACKVATCLPGRAPPEYLVLPLDSAITNTAPDMADGTGWPMQIDWGRGAMAVATECVCAVFAQDAAPVSAGALTATSDGSATTIAAIALDGAPLAYASRILLLHLTDVQGEGTVFADETMRRVLVWGRRPLARAATARIELRLGGTAPTVFALSASGKRLFPVPATFDPASETLGFTASVASPGAPGSPAILAYEVVRE